jgi:putative endonuclease
MITVYILYSTILNKYYIGQTNELVKRIRQHIQTRNLGANDWILKYKEEFPDRATACTREREIKKKKSRKYIEFLVRSG